MYICIYTYVCLCMCDQQMGSQCGMYVHTCVYECAYVFARVYTYTYHQREAPERKEYVQGLWRQRYLRAPAAKEQVQRLRRQQPLWPNMTMRFWPFWRCFLIVDPSDFPHRSPTSWGPWLHATSPDCHMMPPWFSLVIFSHLHPKFRSIQYANWSMQESRHLQIFSGKLEVKAVTREHSKPSL